MRKLGLVCIVLGFLGGAYVSVLDAERIDWTTMGAALLLGLIGVMMVQWAQRGRAKEAGRIARNIAVIESSLESIVEKVGMLDADKEQIHPYDFSRKIDEMLMDDLNAFVDARETIGHAYNLQAYANVMSHFAAGERYLNRVWSASADGYIDEVHAYIGRALEQFKDAKDRLAAEKAAAGA